jgi:hypothetical protein
MFIHVSSNIRSDKYGRPIEPIGYTDSKAAAKCVLCNKILIGDKAERTHRCKIKK